MCIPKHSAVLFLLEIIMKVSTLPPAKFIFDVFFPQSLPHYQLLNLFFFFFLVRISNPSIRLVFSLA